MSEKSDSNISKNKPKVKPSLVHQRNTRNETVDKLLGQPADLPENRLPSKGDIGRAILFHQNDLQNESMSKRNVPFAQVNKILSPKVLGIWQKASIPCQMLKSIDKKVSDLWDKHRKLLMSKKDISETIKAEWNQLFDICLCKCPFVTCEDANCQITKCTAYHGLTCDCPKEKKVPKNELSFLHDQRNARVQVISNTIDMEATNKNIAAQAREEAAQKRAEKDRERVEEQENKEAYEEFLNSLPNEAPPSKKRKLDEDPDFQTPGSMTSRTSSRNMDDLPTTSLGADRLEL